MAQLQVSPNTTTEYEVEITEEGLQEIINKFQEAKRKLLTGQSVKLGLCKIADADLVFVFRPEVPLYGEHMDRTRRLAAPPNKGLAGMN